MSLMFAANLLATALSTQAATAPVAEGHATAPDHSWLEYQLAAAAQPGDALSDLVLADAFGRIHLAANPEPPLPAALRARLESERQRLLAQGEQGLMDDPVRLTLRLSCHENAPEREHCDARRARLAELDPDNAYTAMALMSAAFAAQDDAGFVAAAAMGARASRFEPVLYRVFASLDRRFAAVPDVAVPGLARDLEGVPLDRMSAMAMAAALAMPAYQWFSQPCREAEGELRGHCVAIARRMAESEVTQIDVLIGAAILEAVGSEQDRQFAAARKREVHWLQRQQYQLHKPEAGNSQLAASERYFDTLAEGGELPAMRQLLRDHGVATIPPADWVPNWQP